MSQQQPQHYAFVAASSEPLEVPLDASNEDDPHQRAAPASSSSNQESLVALYQSYAERFPNPNLIQEYQDRDQLLQATSAAHSARSSNVSQQQQQQKKKGLFGFLFGGSNNAEPLPPSRRQAANSDDDDYLVYTEQEDPTTLEDDQTLCGTKHSLDRSCIPQDAHSMARFSLASQRTRQERPHVVRASPHLPTDSTFCIVGLGMIAEWKCRSNNSNAEAQREAQGETANVNSMHMDSHCSVTSDRDDLLRYADNRGFDISLVRAASLGPNFLLVSWGFNDACIVFYRRIALPNTPQIAWEAVVFLGPSPAVLEHSMDVFAEDDDDDKHAGGSDLLRVTDIVPLVVTTPGMPAAALAVSRLGGYMEVLPLPPDLWLGPVLDPSRHKPRPTKRKQKRGQNHYAKQHLVNIASDQAPIPILALTTMEYQLDILCLEAIRTRVTMDTQWDRELYGKAPPPAEYILVASGTQHGHEILTFWSITYMFAEEPPTDGSAGFTLHAVLQEALDVGPMGADLSIFANRAIMDQWRQPRKVALKERPAPPPPPPVDDDGNPLFEVTDDGYNTDSLVDDHVNDQPSVYDRVTTITFSAPIVAMQAIVVPVATGEGDTIFVSMLSLLDWNGSVTIMDCSRLERMISHSLTEEEYAQIHDADMTGDQEGAEPPPPIVLVKTLIGRSRMVQWMKHGSTTRSMQSCVSAQWLARADNPVDPWLVLLTSSSGRNQTNRITILSGLLELDETYSNVAIENVPFPTSRASLQGVVSAMVAPGSAPSPSSLLRIIFPPKSQSGKLCVCLLQPLQPRDIILSLTREHKYEKAIQAARQLSAEEQQHSKILEECRQKLWEQTFNLQWLKQVTDSAYIIQQAFVLFENNNADGGEQGEEHKFENGAAEGGGDNPLLDNMDLDKCRDIYMLALRRTSKIRLASALALGQDGEDVKDKLEGMIVRLGTFQLICQALNAEPSFAKFRNLFLQVSIVDLAKSFAPVGDITALSILWFRHKRELQPHQLELLSQLPMTLKSRNYCYLLPVLSVSHQQDSDRTGSFIADIPPCEGDTLRHISQLPVFLRQEMDIRVVLNSDDERMVLERNSTSVRSSDSLPIEIHGDEVATFFTSRATDMQLFVGDLQDVADFCAVGLVALGNSTNTLDAESIASLSTENDLSSASYSLFCTRGCALALKRMLEESIGDSPLEVGEDGLIDLSPFASVTPLDLISMDLIEVIKMILGGQDDTETIFEIHRQHLVPLLKYLPEHQIDDLDQAIHDFCIELVRSDVAFGSDLEGNDDDNEGDNGVGNIDDTPLMALRTCAAIAVGSRTSIRKTDRIISDKRTLVSLVLTATKEVSKRCHSRRFQKEVSLAVVKLMWGMYESLPVSTSKEDNSTEGYSELMSKADYLYQDLVGLEILSQWPGIHIFSFIAKRMQSRDEPSGEDANQRLHDVGQEALASMCRSFCSQAKRQKGAVGLSSLLRDLVSDIKQFFQVCYDQDGSFLPVLRNTLSSELIAPLSRQAEFDLVAQFLTGVDKSWWDQEQEGRIIGSYVDAIVFSEGSSNPNSEGDHSLQAAIACQDALGPLFLDLQDGFQLSRRYLDAAHFINTVIFTELNMPKQIKPNDLRGDLPLDVVESILRALPTAIIIGCKEWGKEPLAAHANNALRAVQEGSPGSPEQANSTDLPPIPGGAVFHLARILGLEDTAPVLVVKSRVVHYGVASGLFGASAAVCRTILHDQNAFSSDADAVARMTAVAEVVTQEKYEDLATKRELCLVAIRKFQTLTSIHTCNPLDGILETFTALEARTSLAQPRERPQILNIPAPPDSIAALHKDTWSQYSVNIYELFSTLQQHAAGSVVDDSLLNALSRYVFFSCIFRSTRPRHEPAGKLEQATANDLLVIGAALLLHIQDKAGVSIPATKELRQILEKQTMAVINQHPTAFEDPFIKPNEDIVRQLVGRGFTQMSARRSALATKNVGVQQALQWGVANARDPRLNEPIIFVTSPQTVFVEKPSIQQVMNTFNFAQQFLSGSKTIEQWRVEHPLATSDSSPSGKATTRAASSPAPAPAPIPTPVKQKTTAVPAPAPALRLTSAKQKTTAVPTPAANKPVAPLPKPPDQPFARKAPAKAKLTTSTNISPKTATTSTVKVTLPLTSKPSAPAPSAPKPPPPRTPAPHAPSLNESQVPAKSHPPVHTLPQLSSAKNSSFTQPASKHASLAPTMDPAKRTAPVTPTAALPKISKAPPEKAAGVQSAATPSKNLTVNTKQVTANSTNIFTTPTNRPPSARGTGSSAGSDRAALKQRGEAALDALRSTPRSGSHEKNMEDRRRLIEAGRRLLAKSRAENPAPPPKVLPKSPPKVSYTPIGTTPTTKGARGVTLAQSLPVQKAPVALKTAPPPPKQSYFFGAGLAAGKQMSPTPALKQQAPTVPQLSTSLTTQGSLRPATSGAPTGTAAMVRVAPPPPPPPPPAANPDTSESQGGWDDDLDDLGDLADGSAGSGDGWGFEPASAAQPPQLPPAQPPVPSTRPPVPAPLRPIEHASNPDASESQGGWDDDLDGLEDLGDESAGGGDGWNFNESATQNALPSEPTQAAGVDLEATEPAEKDDAIDDGWDDFDDF